MLPGFVEILRTQSLALLKALLFEASPAELEALHDGYGRPWRAAIEHAAWPEAEKVAGQLSRSLDPVVHALQRLDRDAAVALLRMLLQHRDYPYDTVVLFDLIRVGTARGSAVHRPVVKKAVSLTSGEIREFDVRVRESVGGPLDWWHWVEQDDEALFSFAAARASSTTIDSYRGGQTALHLAAERGRVRRVDSLLRLCANVHLPDSSGRTALQLVCERSQSIDQLEIVEMLIAAGADPDAADHAGQSAALGASAEMEHWLRERCAAHAKKALPNSPVGQRELDALCARLIPVEADALLRTFAKAAPHTWAVAFEQAGHLNLIPAPIAADANGLTEGVEYGGCEACGAGCLGDVQFRSRHVQALCTLCGESIRLT